MRRCRSRIYVSNPLDSEIIRLNGVYDRPFVYNFSLKLSLKLV